MIRKILILLAIVVAIAAGVLWADSYRARTTLTELQRRVKELENSKFSMTLDSDLADARYWLQEAKAANCRTWSQSLKIGVDVVTLRLSRRLVSSRPSQTDRSTPGLVGLCYVVGPQVRTSSAQAGPRSKTIDLRFAGFWYARADVSAFTGTTGLIYNVGFPLWSVSFVFIICAVLLIRAPIRSYRRQRRGLCVGCAYDLRGTVAERCSECGLPFTR